MAPYLHSRGLSSLWNIPVKGHAPLPPDEPQLPQQPRSPPAPPEHAGAELGLDWPEPDTLHDDYPDPPTPPVASASDMKISPPAEPSRPSEARPAGPRLGASPAARRALGALMDRQGLRLPPSPSLNRAIDIALGDRTVPHQQVAMCVKMR